MYPTSYRLELCQEAMDYLSQGKSMAALSWHLKIAKSTLYKWCEEHPEFGNAVELGKAHGQLVLEEEGRKSLWANKDFNNVYYLYTMKSQYRVTEPKEEEKKDNQSNVTNIFGLSHEEHLKLAENAVAHAKPVESTIGG